MTRMFSSTLAVIAVAGVVGLSAQTPQPPAERERAAPKVKTVTVTGCVDQAQSSREGPRDSMSSTPFMLKNAEGGTAQSYTLMPSPGADLAAHVNHKVQITGTLAPAAAPPMTSPGAASAPERSRASEMPTLAVQSVKMIANSCTSQ